MRSRDSGPERARPLSHSGANGMSTGVPGRPDFWPVFDRYPAEERSNRATAPTWRSVIGHAAGPPPNEHDGGGRPRLAGRWSTMASTAAARTMASGWLLRRGRSVGAPRLD